MAISNEILSDVLTGKAAANVRLRQVTAADAGKAETTRLLPFSDTAEEVEIYLKNWGLWFVIPPALPATVLLWIHSEELERSSKRRDLREGERRISITGAMATQGPTDDEVSAVEATVEILRSLGAREL